LNKIRNYGAVLRGSDRVSREIEARWRRI
jgi:hypothetical protein